MVSHLLEKLRRSWQAFGTARAGNVVITFALALVPIVGAVGAAVDYSRGNSARTAMQAALDSTVLMLAKDAATISDSQLDQRAMQIFQSLFTRPDVKSIKVNPTLTNPQKGVFVLNATATGVMDTAIIRAVGQTQMNLSVSSTSQWGMKRLEIALALDNTGSMAWSNKMTELKKAAHGLVDTLKKAAKKKDDVKIAIIPFDTTVNIGTGYKDELWFDIDSMDCNGKKKGTGCNATNWKPFWDGCVRDRTQPNDATDVAPVIGVKSTLFPVYDCGSLAQMLPLTDNWSNLHDKIDEMQPNGNTDVTIGLAWGWHALSPTSPLTEASAPQPDLDKVLIILTDGTNTEAWDNSTNSAYYSESLINQRTAAACQNIKAANIQIYAVRVIDGNANLLRNCATNPGMYFDVQQASQLNSVFSTIAQNLANLRIAK